ncbi:hypothetical protein RIF23_04205 [Lipingzhangella sp. LS1_29]|uniref:Uncharacterized protein n=1 Tax=Lipingzhangella rawalii TaxID=2055835 RepID=A0ABU2H2I4_9ACTN|nr:hypothetical protein [Lipingzhangella rawalii]MDS1269497.1 hypothetical protein [Lipingzhangella rawalii]
MAWTWRCAGSDGQVLDLGEINTETFPSRGDAETWLGENWQDLAEAGASHVTLVQDDDTVVYTMSLAAE